MKNPDIYPKYTILRQEAKSSGIFQEKKNLHFMRSQKASEITFPERVMNKMALQVDSPFQLLNSFISH